MYTYIKHIFTTSLFSLTIIILSPHIFTSITLFAVSLSSMIATPFCLSFLQSKLFDTYHSQNHLPPSISPHLFPEHSSCTFSIPVLRFLVYLLHSSFVHSTFRSLFLASSHLLSCLPRNSYYNFQI